MIHLEARGYLVRQGENASSAFLVESGCLEVILEREDGETLLAVLGPGEIVGEMALVDASPRSASVRAREASTLLPITAGQIEGRLAGADPVLRLLLDTVLTRFRTTLTQVRGHVEPPRVRPDNSAIKAAALAQLATARELANAIAGDEIIVHYQPIIDLADGSIAGFEALARWLHPVRGLIPPGFFVPVAEANALSAALTLVCLRIVARDYPRLAAASETRAPLRVSINISGQDLCDGGFFEAMGDVAGPITDCITLELTETALIQNSTAAAQCLGAARALGFRIAVDDFGAGYASYGYVQTLPVDTLKIDKTFVQGMGDSFTSRSITLSMVNLAEALGLATVGEGIETEGDLESLRASGCTYGQGFLFSRPLPFVDALAFLEGWAPTDLFRAASPEQAGDRMDTAHRVLMV